jgi:DNA polymerase epsilon subunit 2
MTPVESLVGNPGQKLTFGLMSRVPDDKERRWVIEDLHKVYPVDLQVHESDHIMTDGSFVLAEGEVVGGNFVVKSLEVPEAISRGVSFDKDLIPVQAFGGNLSDEQLRILDRHEHDGAEGMFVIITEVHLDNPRVIEKLTELFQGYEDATPPEAYIFMGSFCSSTFVQSADGVRSYKEGFERLKFMMRSLQNHVKSGTRFVFIPGPKDPGAQSLPRMPLTGFLTSDIAKDVPNVFMASNPCRIRHFSRELVFFRHDVLRLLRRHEILPLRDPSTGGAPSPQHLREEMVRFLADQAHLVPLPLEESNILWSYDYALRLYPLPHATFIGGVSEAFDCKYLDSTFCSVGPFFRDASFYAYYPGKDVLEPCDVPDRGA